MCAKVPIIRISFLGKFDILNLTDLYFPVYEFICVVFQHLSSVGSPHKGPAMRLVCIFAISLKKLLNKCQITGDLRRCAAPVASVTPLLPNRRFGEIWFVYTDKTVYLYYHQFSNIIRTQSQNMNVSRFVLQLSLPNPLKPGVKLDRWILRLNGQ